MTDDLSPREQLDALYGTAMAAHEAVHDLYDELADRGRTDDRVRALLAESAEITLRLWPPRLGRAEELASTFSEQELLADRGHGKLPTGGHVIPHPSG